MSNRRPGSKHDVSYILNNPSNSSRMTIDTPSSDRKRSSASSSQGNGERKYKCTDCPDRKFKVKGDLQKHIKIVHHNIRDHICPECGYKFGEKGNLNRHQKRHEGKRDFICPVPGCDGAFVLKDGLKRHQKHVHGMDVDSGSSSRH